VLVKEINSILEGSLIGRTAKLDSGLDLKGQAGC
jgi:tetrahydromethanopterin S-methyltransferase subunit F